MARLGQFNPRNARFQGLPLGSFLYVMEIGEAVKVGRTTMPGHRFTSLREKHDKRGESIGRFEILSLEDLYRHDCRIETQAVRALTTIAKPLPRRREYFTGITYEAAVDVVRNVIRAAA